MERGTVIHADMAIFQFGATALGLAQPVAPGSAPTPSPAAARDRSRFCTAPAAWTPPRNGWPTTHPVADAGNP